MVVFNPVGIRRLRAYGLVFGLSVVDPLAAPIDITVIVGFFRAMFIVEHVFRMVEHYHCERTRSVVTAVPSSCASNSSRIDKRNSNVIPARFHRYTENVVSPSPL